MGIGNTAMLPGRRVLAFLVSTALQAMAGHWSQTRLSLDRWEAKEWVASWPPGKIYRQAAAATMEY